MYNIDINEVPRTYNTRQRKQSNKQTNSEKKRIKEKRKGKTVKDDSMEVRVSKKEVDKDKIIRIVSVRRKDLRSRDTNVCNV